MKLEEDFEVGQIHSCLYSMIWLGMFLIAVFVFMILPLL